MWIEACLNRRINPVKMTLPLMGSKREGLPEGGSKTQSVVLKQILLRLSILYTWEPKHLYSSFSEAFSLELTFTSRFERPAGSATLLSPELL